MSGSVHLHSGETKRSVLPATILIKPGKNETFNTHCGQCMVLRRFTVDGGSIAEIILLFINIDVCEGWWLRGTMNFTNEIKISSVQGSRNP